MICTGDLFGCGLAVYKRKVTMEGCEDVAYDDGSHVYLLNSAYTTGNADDAILEFLNCIRNNDTSTAAYKTTLMQEVCPAINEIREDPGKEAEYMTWQTKLMDVEYEALERGRKKGREEGREEGIQQGAAEERFEIARAMIADSEPVEKIKRYTGLTSEEIERLRVEA